MLGSSISSSRIILLSLFFCIPSLSQVENVSTENEVYTFLNRMYLHGHLPKYDNVILPLSRGQIAGAINSIDSVQQKLNPTDQKILEKYKVKFGLHESAEIVQLLDAFPEKFMSNVFSENEKHLYFYNDSIINIYVDPIIESRFLYSTSLNKGSTILNYGGHIRGSYDGWLGFYINATNGIVGGNRSVALQDKRVEQSFTFNDTKINFFDNTTGYLRMERGIVNLQLGRERILWGTGQINKLILSENPPVFDFIKFNISYKSIKYDFLHGWLVMKPEFILINSEVSKEKRSKYLAISRLGFNPNPDLFFGISQMIIYSNRPFEISYLNPFLFWESAQRSLNDLDNSFLSFDGKYRIVNGLLVNASAIFDDINFGRLFKGEWSGHNNGFGWQAGVTLTSPIIFDNATFDLEYLQLRPYLFSHWGFKEALTYTSNGYMLGVDLNPNSTLFSAKVEYDLSSRFTVKLKFGYSNHGNNEYDSAGIRIRNVGGNVFEPYTLNDSMFAELLDGVREKNYRLEAGIKWEFFNNIFLNLNYTYNENSLLSTKKTNYITATFKLDFN